MINLNMLVDHVKARLGASHRQLELSDKAIMDCLQNETLKTLSVYHPYYCQIVLNLAECSVAPNMNTYFVPEKLGDDFDVVGVEYVLPVASGTASSSLFFLPAGPDLQTIIGSLAMTKLANSIGSATINPATHQWLAPNMIRLMNNFSVSDAMLVARTTHKRDFTTFPFGMLDTIKKLALYDVAMDIYSIRKYFSNVQTMFAQIQLDMSFFETIPDKRDELIERMRKDQLKYSNTKKIYLA